jgi:hypothetical protein
MQCRHLRRFSKLCWQKSTTESNNAALKRENERLRAAASSLKAYVGNFLSNVWRTIHEEPKERWPSIFGKLYSDHFKGVARGSCVDYRNTG